MSKTITEYVFKNSMPGTSRKLLIHRYIGGKSDKKLYIQASLHADELPALMAANHLLKKLDEIDQQGLIDGEIVFLPMANPIGLSQFIMGKHCGRLEADTGINFNRAFPDLAEKIAPLLGEKLGDNAEANLKLIRQEMLSYMDSLESFTEQDEMKNLLFRLALDSDIVLDLHCDFDSLLHLYIGTPHWPEFKDLAQYTRSEVTLLADESGCEPFDEALAKPWWKLAKIFPDKRIPPALMAATIELRGESDVNDELGDQDSSGIINFLCARGFIKKAPPKAPHLIRDACDLSACDMLRSISGGVIAWKKNLGDKVETGDVIAEIINPEARDFDSSRSIVKARSSGVLFSRRRHAYIMPGQIIAKLAGEKNLEWRQGNLLSD